MEELKAENELLKAEIKVLKLRLKEQKLMLEYDNLTYRIKRIKRENKQLTDRIAKGDD
jgi:hypothetical protein